MLQDNIVDYQKDYGRTLAPLLYSQSRAINIHNSYTSKKQHNFLYNSPEDQEPRSRLAKLGIFSLMALCSVGGVVYGVTDAFAEESTSLTWCFSSIISRQPISNIGLYIPAPLLAEEISKIEQFETTRNKYLNWQKDLDVAGLSKETAVILGSATTADHAILKNMQPDDLAGMFKERREIKIISKKGAPYNHIEEVQSASRAIKNTILRIQNRVIEIQKMQMCNSIKEVKLLLEKTLRLLEIEQLYCTLNNTSKSSAQKRYSFL